MLLLSERRNERCEASVTQCLSEWPICMCMCVIVWLCAFGVCLGNRMTMPLFGLHCHLHTEVVFACTGRNRLCGPVPGLLTYSHSTKIHISHVGEVSLTSPCSATMQTAVSKLSFRNLQLLVCLSLPHTVSSWDFKQCSPKQVNNSLLMIIPITGTSVLEMFHGWLRKQKQYPVLWKMFL